MVWIPSKQLRAIGWKSMKLAPDWRRGKIYGTNETKGPCARLVDGATVYTGTKHAFMCFFNIPSYYMSKKS